MEVTSLPVAGMASATSGAAGAVASLDATTLSTALSSADLFAALLAQQLTQPAMPAAEDLMPQVATGLKINLKTIGYAQDDHADPLLDIPTTPASTAADPSSASNLNATPVPLLAPLPAMPPVVVTDHRVVPESLGAHSPVSAEALPASVSVSSDVRQLLAAKPASFAVTEADPAQAQARPGTDATPLFAISPPVMENTADSRQMAQPVTVPVGDAHWGAAIGDRVVWMVGQQHQNAEIHLNPPSLGPLEVQVKISDGQANLSFSTQHLPVKEAIESATGRLREMLGDSGINLGSVSVNVGNFSQQQTQQQAQQFTQQSRSNWAGGMQSPEFSSDFSVSLTPLPRSGNGMVDLFA